VVGLCLDPLGELTALPRAPGWIRGKEGRGGEGKGDGRKEGRRMLSRSFEIF